MERCADCRRTRPRACVPARESTGPISTAAAIQAVHSDAARADETDWSQILALYDQLLVVAPNPVVAINRAVAVAEVHGASTALRALKQHPLPDYHVHHAVRGELLDRLGRHAEAIDAYTRAAALTGNATEREFLQRKGARVRTADAVR